MSLGIRAKQNVKSGFKGVAIKNAKKLCSSVEWQSLKSADKNI